MRWTERRKMFCWHMARCNVGVDAARLAGYEDNPNSLKVEATRLMKEVAIRREIHKQRQYYLASIGADKDRLMAETLARAGITHDGTVYTAHDFITSRTVKITRRKRDGTETSFETTKYSLVPKEELPLAAQRMVQSIKISYSPGGEENIEVKFFDQLKAIELAARLAQLLTADKDAGANDAQEIARKVRDALSKIDSLEGEDSPYVEPGAEDADGSALPN